METNTSFILEYYHHDLSKIPHCFPDRIQLNIYTFFLETPTIKSHKCSISDK